MRTVTAPTPSQLDRARNVIRQHFAPTPLWGTTLDAHPVWLKLETFQPTGSFKVRGALAALTATGNAGRIVTASAGNHALGVAWASRRLGIPATIVVAETAAPVKIAKLRALGADLVLHGATYDEAEAHGIALGSEPGNAYLSPYNDPDVIAGQATVLDELLAQLPDDGKPVTIVVPVGGGGLLAGIALRAAEQTEREIRLLGVEAAASQAVSSSVAAGHTTGVPIGETLADGLSGNVEAGSVTVEIIRDHRVPFLAVSEDAIRDGIRWLVGEQGLVAEGSAATAIAALRQAPREEDDGHVVALITGRNVTWSVVAQVMTATSAGR